VHHLTLYKTVDLSDKNTNRNKLKSKYFIVVLSNKRNLDLCRDKKIAGFPETNNGQWAFLDIDVGDYISFYYNGRIWDLYEVDSKFIPDQYLKKLARGDKDLDPEPLNDGKNWCSIEGGTQYIYFPFRLELKKKVETEFDSNIVFKNGFERLGINLVPRVSLKKTHFQLSIKDINRIFNNDISINKKEFTIDTFVKCKRRSQHRRDQKNSIRFKEKIIDEITHQEIYLQSFMKKLLETQINQIKIVEDCDCYEFLSEQTTDGGESDIVILCKSNNEEFEFYIELKNNSMIRQNDCLTARAKQAKDQVSNYRNILDEKLTLRGIGGKKGNNDKSLRIYKLESNTDNLFIFELDSNTPLSIFN
jgi:hypothetical protein